VRYFYIVLISIEQNLCSVVTFAGNTNLGFTNTMNHFAYLGNLRSGRVVLLYNDYKK